MTDVASPEAEVAAGARAKHLYRSLKKIRRNRMSFFGLLTLASIVFLAFFAPLLSPYDPYFQHWGEEISPPSSRYLLGADDLGRDVLSRVIWGARTSMLIGVSSILLMVSLGILVGAVSGYFGGAVDIFLMRLTDIVLTLPGLFLLILAASVFRTRDIYVIMLMLGFTGWPALARVVRGSFLSLKEEMFVEAERSMGAGDLRIIFKHILPNSLSPIIVLGTLRFATAIIAEASLSFLGLGDPNVVSWGLMLSEGRGILRIAPWVSTFPGIAIFITVMGLNMLGDGLRDALDVRI